MSAGENIEEAVERALYTCYGNRPDAKWHVDDAGYFRPAKNPEAFEIVLEEIERQGWVYEHSSYLAEGQRVHSFWIGKPDETAEMGIVHPLGGVANETYPTRLIAGCYAFVAAVSKEMPDGNPTPDGRTYRNGRPYRSRVESGST